MKTMMAPVTWWTFIRGFLRSPRGVGAIVPSSPWLVEAMVDAARIEETHTVVEFGSGTGVVTEGIIRRLHPRAQLIAFEVDEHFAANLRARITDPRVTIITASAVDAPHYLAQLGLRSADRVISSLPLTSLPRPLTQRILRTAAGLLRPGGLFVTYQFSAVARPLIERYFPQTLTNRRVLRNLPPAVVYVCPRQAEVPRQRLGKRFTSPVSRPAFSTY